MAERRRHLCHACGVVDVWGEGWSQYGSVIDEDAGRTVVTCPAPACKAQAPELHRRQPAGSAPYRPFGYG